YEVWDYLYRRGYYPMVTLTQSDSAELLRGYRPVAPQQHWTSATAPVAPETANIAHSTSTPAVATTAGEPLQSAQSQQSMQTQNDFAAEALHTEPE
ncbi:hypothetical protein MXD81_18430, partial [Microbacteriaceae bacterium K1510]|nr:hypothetical protein [Microbacteriaceae bacterium K1510]